MILEYSSINHLLKLEYDPKDKFYFNTIYLTPTEQVTSIKVEENEIHINEFTFRVGDEFSVTATEAQETINLVFEINHLYYKDNKIIIKENEISDAFYFIFPCLFNKKLPATVDYKRYLSQTLIDKESIYIKLRYTPSALYEKRHKELVSNPLFKELLISKDKRFNLYVLSIPEIFKNDVDLISKGKFHEISNELKELIIKFHNLRPTDYLYQVIYKSPKLEEKLKADLGIAHIKGIDKIFENLGLRSIPKNLWIS